MFKAVLHLLRRVAMAYLQAVTNWQPQDVSQRVCVCVCVHQQSAHQQWQRCPQLCLCSALAIGPSLL
jgi:hypothetical protein